MYRLLVHAFVTAAAATMAYSQEFDPTVCMQLPDDTKIVSPFLCNQFFVCESGMLSSNVGTCPSNMLFNPDILDCDFAENVDCRGVPLPPGFETEETTTQDTETEKPTIPSSGCPPEDADDPIYLPVENDCSSYILCYHGRETLWTCAAGLFWDSKTLKCESSSKVQCQKNDEFGCPRDGIEFLPHPDSCKKYIYCRDGYSRVQNCAFYKVYDVEQKTCVFGSSCE